MQFLPKFHEKILKLQFFRENAMQCFFLFLAQCDEGSSHAPSEEAAKEEE